MHYHSLVGPLEVTRATYRQAGVRNGPTVVPLELIAGLAESTTPALAFSIALGYSRSDMREHLDNLEAAHRIPPSRATLERIAKVLAATVHREVIHVENQLRRVEKLHDKAHAICVGLERTSVPMAELRDEDAPEKKPKRKTPRIRRAPAPIDVKYRMAYVGTVSIVDEYGQALVTRRYASPANDDPAVLGTRMSADVRSALRDNSALSVGIVQDGAPEMWNVVRAALKPLVRDGLIDDWQEAIDRYHLLERMSAAFAIAEPDDIERHKLLNKFRERFDVADSTIDCVQHHLKKCYAKLPTRKQTALWEHLVYIRNNKERLRYVGLRLRGLPVGSGVTESAAKTVIAARAKRSGQRWSESGLRGALTIRALDQSQRLPDFWQRFSRRYTARVQAA